MTTRKLKEVKISRKRWCRGGGGAPALRTESGQSCCLGFVARAYGLRTPTGSAIFSQLANQHAQDCSVLPKALRPTEGLSGNWDDTDLHEDLTEANDDADLKGAGRERKIASLLRKAGIRAIFVD